MKFKNNSDLILLTSALSLIPILMIFVFYNVFFNHDTLSEFINYKYTFDSFALTGKFPLWNPYLAYGISTSLTNFSTSGTEYLSILIGKLVGSTNSLPFFNLSIILDSFLYISGIILILQHLKIEKIIIFFSIFVAAFSLNPIHQIYFDHSLIVKIPLLIYSIIYLSENFYKRIVLFLLFQLSYIYSGEVTYFLIVYAYLSIMIFLILIYWDKNMLNINTPLLLNHKNFLLMGLLISLIFFYYINIMDFLTNYQFISPGRGQMGEMTFNNFINYGGYNNLEKLKNFIGGKPVTQDFDLHLGIIPIALSAMSLLYLNKLSKKIKRMTALLWILIVGLIIFSHAYDQSIIHKIIYYFPGMSKVRHLAYFLSIAKPIFIILSGIGLHVFLKYCKTIKDITINEYLALFIAFLLLSATLYWEYYFQSIVFTLFITLSTLAIRNKIQPYVICIAILALCSGDLIFHKFTVYPYKDYIYDQFKFNSIGNNHFPFVNRTDPAKSQKNKEFKESLPTKGFARYDSENSYIKEDYCYQIYRQDFLLKTVYKELSANNLNFNPSANEFHENETNKTISRKKFGCERPKIELIPPGLAKNIPINGNLNLKNEDYKNINADNKKNSFSLNKYNSDEINFDINNAYTKTLPLIYYDSFHTYWESFTDGKENKIYLFNGAFKGIYLPPGSHKVTFQIKRLYIYLEMARAAVLSILTLLILFWLINKISKEKYNQINSY